MDQFAMSAQPDADRLVTAVLICGGSGDTLWPASRAQIPEALADLGRDLTLLQEAALKAAQEHGSRIVAAGNEEHRFLILDQLQDVGLVPRSIILCGEVGTRSNALAAIAAVFEDSDEQLCILAADQPAANGADHELLCTGRELVERCRLGGSQVNKQLEEDGVFIRVAGVSELLHCADPYAEPQLPDSGPNSINWNSVWELSGKDEQGNVVRGTAMPVDTANSLIQAEAGITVATLGVSNHVIVAMSDAVLVASRERAGDLPELVKALNAAGNSTAREPGVVHRPWGTYQTTDRDERFQTKRIVVKPGAKLSSQLHHHRSEHWVVVSGTAEVTVGEKTFLLHENESTYIKAGTVHRLANPGRVPLHLVEVQCGTYLGEDDIVRFDDVYGRS